jgi:hypothetical protein
VEMLFGIRTAVSTSARLYIRLHMPKRTNKWTTDSKFKYDLKICGDSRMSLTGFISYSLTYFSGFFRFSKFQSCKICTIFLEPGLCLPFFSSSVRFCFTAWTLAWIYAQLQVRLNYSAVILEVVSSSSLPEVCTVMTTAVARRCFLWCDSSRRYSEGQTCPLQAYYPKLPVLLGANYILVSSLPDVPLRHYVHVAACRLRGVGWTCHHRRLHYVRKGHTHTISRVAQSV